MTTNKPVMRTIKLEIREDSRDFELLCELMNCGEFLDNSIYENTLVNNILEKIVTEYTHNFYIEKTK